MSAKKKKRTDTEAETFFDNAEDELDKQEAWAKRTNDAEWWSFVDRGEEIGRPEFQGRFKEVTFIPKTGDDGSSYLALLVYLEDLEGTLWRVWASHSSLKQGLINAAPAVDALTLIRFEGREVVKKSGNKFFRYSVVTADQDLEKWDALEKAYNSRSVTAAQAGNRTEYRSLDPDEAPF